MPTVLITGAGRGLGFEFARQYAADGWRVFATHRNPSGADQLKILEGDLNLVVLDVTNYGAIDVLAHNLRRESIDVLLNNAGIYGPRPSPLGSIDYAAWEEVMQINVYSVLRVSEAFSDHVARSERKIIAALGSKMGSMTNNTSGGSYIYRSSKAALNSVMKSLSVDLAAKGIVVGVFHPGWVRTDIGGPSAQINVEVSVKGIIKVIAGLSPERSGRFFNYGGAEIPW